MSRPLARKVWATFEDEVEGLRLGCTDMYSSVYEMYDCVTRAGEEVLRLQESVEHSARKLSEDSVTDKRAPKEGFLVWDDCDMGSRILNIVW